MTLRGKFSLGIARLAAVFSMLAALAFPCATPRAFAQSESGFTYNGIDFISYQASEYLNSSTAAQSMKATGANYAAVVVTQYVQTGDATSIAPETTSSPGFNGSQPITPTDGAVVAAIESLQAQGITVVLKPLVNSIDGTWNGNFTWPSSDTTTAEQQAWLTAWFTSYQTFILHYAQLASQNNVSELVIGTELVQVTGQNCAGASCKSYWDQYVINPIRTSYPNLRLSYGSNASTPGDEFSTVTFWDEVDVIGVDGYLGLTNQADPTVSQLVSAWTNSPKNGGYNAVAAFANLASTYNKPLIFTEIGYESTPGTNEEPWSFSLSDGYDPTEQADCYEAFFEVFSAQTSWMKGVFWWEWNVSPPGASDPGYTPQNKPAGDTVLPKWFGSATPSFSLAPSDSSLSIGQGLSSPDIISVTDLGGFTGTVTLSASGLPSGVTAAFSAGTVAGTQVLTLTASSGATPGGPVTVTVKGTSGSLTATTTIAVTVLAPASQTIAFSNPGAQLEGTLLTLTGVASSGLPVSYNSSTTGICTVNNTTGTALLLEPGTCTLTASQAGQGIYLAATPVTQSFLVSALTAAPVPAGAKVIVSQVNWLAALNGSALVSSNPAGSSFGVNTSGEIAVADTNNLVLFNAQTGATITLGAWSNASALAIDSKNNLYAGNPFFATVNDIVMIPYVGGTANGGYAAFTTPQAGMATCTAASKTECVLPSTLGAVNPGAMAFDAQDDLFWVSAADGASGGNGIWECTVACLGGSASPVQIYQEPTASPAPSSSSGQPLIGGLDLDTAGNVFFTDSSIFVDPSTSAITSFYSHLNELPVSSGAGYAGQATGYSASPIILYTVTPPTVEAYDSELDGVAVQRSASNGDTVYFADKSDGVFAFPDTTGGIPLANGQPTALYMVSSQGAKSLALDSSGNLYLAVYSSLINTSGSDTLAQITINNVTVPVSPAGTAISPSATLNPVRTILNDTSCTGTPAPSVTFSGTSATATATIDAAAGSCFTTLSGGASLATTVSFTPTVAGADSISLTGTDQAGKTGTVVVSGLGEGFTLSPSAPTLTVGQGSIYTDTITVTGIGGFTGSVTLAASGLPSGVTASFATNPATSSSVLSLTVSSTATAGGPVTVTISGTSGTLTASTTIALTVNTTPSFSLTQTAPTLSVTQGSSNTNSIVVTPANGFSGSVTLAASGLPSGVTAGFNPNPTSTGTSTLTLTASSTAATGNSTIGITGTSGTLIATTTIALTVSPPPSFTLSASPATLPVAQGSSGATAIQVTGAGGFSGNVTLTASGLPSGVTASFTPNPAASSSVLTLTASSSAPLAGPVTVTINGTSGTLTASTSVALTVTPLTKFTLLPSPTGIVLAQGGSGTSTLSIASTSNFSGNVTLAATGLPSGVTASFSPNPATSSSVMTLTASSAATVGGPVIVNINGTSGTLTASTAIALTVTPPPGFTLAPSPATLSLGQGSSAASSIFITSIGGFSGSVTLAASGLPSGVTASFAPNPATNASVLTLTASSTAAAAGPVTVNLTGSSGAVTASATLALTVSPPPGFTLAAAPATLSVGQGSSATSSISVTGVGGFTGNVTLAASGLPSGVTASFAPNPATGSSVLTLAASSAATLGGPVTVTLNGSSGALNASTTIALTVTAAPTFAFSGTAVTVAPGATTGNTSTITVTPANGFTGAISLSCSVTPALTVDPVTCSLSPTSVTISGSTAQTATLTLNTTAPTSAENHMKRLFWPPAGGTALALVLLFGVPRRKRAWMAMVGLLALFVCFGAMGCNSVSTGSSTSTTRNTGTAAGTYTVTVTGISGTIAQAGQISLTVQ